MDMLSKVFFVRVSITFRITSCVLFVVIDTNKFGSFLFLTLREVNDRRKILWLKPNARER